MTRSNNCYEVSVYAGELSKICIAKNVVKLKQAFPSLPPEFFNVFSERIKAHNYSDKRLTDAIAHVIDNCVYPSPTIAQFISFDKKIKLYTYDDIVKLNDSMNCKAFKEYRPVRYEDAPRPFYASLNDIAKYKLRLWGNL